MLPLPGTVPPTAMSRLPLLVKWPVAIHVTEPWVVTWKTLLMALQALKTNGPLNVPFPLLRKTETVPSLLPVMTSLRAFPLRVGTDRTQTGWLPLAAPIPAFGLMVLRIMGLLKKLKLVLLPGVNQHGAIRGVGHDRIRHAVGVAVARRANVTDDIRFRRETSELSRVLRDGVAGLERRIEIARAGSNVMTFVGGVAVGCTNGTGVVVGVGVGVAPTGVGVGVGVAPLPPLLLATDSAAAGGGAAAAREPGAQY